MNIHSFRPDNLAKGLQSRIDHLRGLDFLGGVESTEFGLDPNLVHASHPSGNRYLERVLHDMAINPKDAILDIGCGKGSAMRSMLKFPFRRVDGLDLAKPLTDIAQHNFQRLGESRVTIYLEDATCFQQLEPYNIIYFYNPFPAVVMGPVMEAVTRAARQRPDETILIYNNPTCDRTVTGPGYFNRILVYPDQNRNGIFIYSNRPYPESRFYRRSGWAAAERQQTGA